MADERDPKVSQRYRELRGEEPPRELDRAIIAAAHRATDRPHAPLVPPAGRRRWYVALGAAAILVLAVGIALHIESDRSDPEAPPALERSPASPQGEQRSAPAAAEPEQAPAAGGRLSDQRSEPAMPAESPSVSAARVESPERWLERIVQLRKEGKHEEADGQLAEFRRRYPDHKIPEGALK